MPRGGALGLIAGAGDLPRLIAEDLHARDEGMLVVRYEGVVAPWADRLPHVDLPYEKPGRLFAALRGAGCTRICFAGGMSRPKLDPLRFDLKALSLLPKVPALLRQGDDALLRGLAAILAAEGFEMVAAHDLLAGLLAPEGALAARPPTEAEREDAARAARIVAALGAVDVGQAAVVAGGLCLGVEAIAGTDALLAEVARVPARLRVTPGGVLFKGPKPGQDRRMDLPAAGPETLRRAAAAGLTGVAVSAGGVLLLGRAEMAAEADRLDLALWGAAP